MELDFVDARSEAVVGTKARAVLVRLEPPGHRLGAGGSPRKGAHLGLGPASPFPAQPIQQREVACQRVVALQGRRLVQDLVRGHAPTLSHVEWPGSAEVLEQPQLPLAKTAHAQTQLRLAQQIRQRRQGAVFHVAGAEGEHDAVAVFAQDLFQQLPGVVKMQLAAMSPKLVGAILAVEDIRFYEHSGIDWRRVAGAIWRDIRDFSLREGSSPIRVQLARNVVPDGLTRARSLRRKLAEMIVARRIEREFTKPQILEMYLNQIYLANGYYGVEAASHGYFERTALELSVSQAALLAALPTAPSNYDPRRFPEPASKRRNLVLAQMLKQKVISPKEEAIARNSKLRLSAQEQEGDAPWFVAAVRRELNDRFGQDAETQGLRVRTTLDAGLQRAAEKELARQIEAAESGKLGRLAVEKCNGDPEE